MIIEQLGRDVNSTAIQIAKITKEVTAINVGNTSLLANITDQLFSIDNIFNLKCN